MLLQETDGPPGGLLTFQDGELRQTVFLGWRDDKEGEGSRVRKTVTPGCDLKASGLENEPQSPLSPPLSEGRGSYRVVRLCVPMSRTCSKDGSRKPDYQRTMGTVSEFRDEPKDSARLYSIRLRYLPGRRLSVLSAGDPLVTFP